MFEIKNDKSIHITRGDIAVISVSASNGESEHTFVAGDIVRINVHEKKNPKNVVLQKDVEVQSETKSVDISLTREDTKIGNLISKPVEYWYEIELNPDTMPQTIIGYYEDGEKVFMLYPEGGEAE